MTDPLREVVTTALRGVIDPETGRDLVAMGLIYDIAISDTGVCVTMTTTTRGCPLSEMLRLGAEAAISAAVPDVPVRVSLTWEPAWTPDRIAPMTF